MKFSRILLSIMAISLGPKINATDSFAGENNSYVINIPDVEQYDRLQKDEPNKLREALEVAWNVVQLIPQYPLFLAGAIADCVEDTVYAFSVLGNDIVTLSRIQNDSLEKFESCIANGLTSVKRHLANTYVLENIADCES